MPRHVVVRTTSPKLGVIVGVSAALAAITWLVAALFAIHPLHVESVAWISERKDVLSALFFMLTLGTYVRLCTRVLACSLPALPALLRSGSDVETDAGDGSIRFAAFGLLAARKVRSCEVSGAHGAATTNQQAATNGHSPDNRKDSVLCAVRSFFRGDAADSVP